MGGRGSKGIGRRYSTFRHYAWSDSSSVVSGVLEPQVEQAAVTVLAPEPITDTALVTADAQTEQASVAASSSPTASATMQAAVDESQLPPVTIINQETALGGAIYPFLEQTGRAWAVVSSDLEDPTPYPRAGTFGMTQPTLRYVKDNKIEDVFVDGMTTEQFLAKSGLQLSMNKGGFVLSKRLSRVMRPYFASGSFPAEAVTIRYLAQHYTLTPGKIKKSASEFAARQIRSLITITVIPPEC